MNGLNLMVLHICFKCASKKEVLIFYGDIMSEEMTPDEKINSLMHIANMMKNVQVEKSHTDVLIQLTITVRK